jgi:RNA-directed DNA polymerase
VNNVQDDAYNNLVHQLYLAYFDARKNKRNTHNQLAFEVNFESNLIQLADKIHSRAYTPKPSIAFIVNKPVKREIFAAHFSDRVVHHLIYRAINPQVDRHFIHDAYSCRKNKGNLYGIQRAKHFIRSATQNHQQQAFVLKLDIQGYFMHIEHEIIYQKTLDLLDKNALYNTLSFELIDYLLQRTIFNDVAQDCHIKGSGTEWRGLPKDKSLFHTKKGVGLPIGNLTSQLFGNIYLNSFDHYVKKTLKIKHYGRYVDDMLFVHQDKERLKSVVAHVNHEVGKIGLQLHPKKIYLQSCDHGVLFLGQYIKPYRSYISNRVKHYFYQTLHKVNCLLVETEAIEWQVMKQIQSSLNAYLGILKHANTYNLIKKACGVLIKRFYCFFTFSVRFTQVYINKGFWQWHYSLTCQSIS